MARRNLDTTELKALTGGIELDSSPFDVPDNCVIGCQNVLPSLNVGGLSVINGYTVQNLNSQLIESGVGVPINGLISFYNQNGNTEYFVAQAGSDIWSNSPEGTWSKITGSLAITSAQDNLASMAVLNNFLYGVNRLENQFWYWGLTGNAIAVPVGALYTVGSVLNGGQNYVVGDILTVPGGTGGTVTVTGVQAVGDLTGVIDGIAINAPGNGYVTSTLVTPTGGSGTGASFSIDAVTPMINGNFLVNFNDTMFVNGGSSFPTGMYYSDLNIGYNINPVNFLLFNDGQGNYLTGAVNALFGNLFVFKNKSIHVVSPTGSTPAYSSFLYCDGIGCVSHQSIVTLPGGTIMFWDTDDIYMIEGNQVLSATNHPKNKTPRLRNFFRNNVNSARLNKVVGAYYPALDCVFWFYSSPSSNSNDQCIAYHVKTESYWLLSLRGTSCCTRVIQNESFLYTGDINGSIYEQDSGGSFNGSPINWSVQIPWQDMGEITIRKKGDLVYTVVQNQSGNGIYYDIYLNQQTIAWLANQILQLSADSGDELLTETADDILTESGIDLLTENAPNGSGGLQFDTAKFDTATFAGQNTQLMEASGAIQTLFKSISINFHGSCTSQPMTMYRIALTTRSLEFTRLTD